MTLSGRVKFSKCMPDVARVERGFFGSDAKGFPYSDSGSSRIRFTADLASHSRAFCRNSAALCSASFSFMRI